MAPMPFAAVGTAAAEPPAFRRRLITKMTTAMIATRATMIPKIRPMLRPDDVVLVTAVLDVGVLIGMGRQTYHWLAFYFRELSYLWASPGELGYESRNP